MIIPFAFLWNVVIFVFNFHIVNSLYLVKKIRFIVAHIYIIIKILYLIMIIWNLLTVEFICDVPALGSGLRPEFGTVTSRPVTPRP